MVKVKDIKFDSNGLVVAIAVDARTNEVLMQAYMNKQSLEMTLDSGYAHYYSRSRQKLWKKGEESGHTQKVISVFADCDNDSILLRVEQKGVACHTGSKTCFFGEMKTNRPVASLLILQENIDTIKQRKLNPVEGSYTNYLLSKGIEKIAKKVGEESAESIIASIKGDREELANELADLYYHTLVMLESMGMSLYDVMDVLAQRHSTERTKEYNVTKSK